MWLELSAEIIYYNHYLYSIVTTLYITYILSYPKKHYLKKLILESI